MKVFLCGSSNLTRYDREDIANYLEKYAPNNEIHLMCYHTVENEVLKYYIQNDEYASKLHIYTFQAFQMLPNILKQPIQFLKEKGSFYHSFERAEMQILRSAYEQTMKTIVSEVDLVVCFYNKDKHTAVIPVDIAKELNVDAMYFDLPGFDEDKLSQGIEKKVRVV